MSRSVYVRRRIALALGMMGFLALCAFWQGWRGIVVLLVVVTTVVVLIAGALVIPRKLGHRQLLATGAFAGLVGLLVGFGSLTMMLIDPRASRYDWTYIVTVALSVGFGFGGVIFGGAFLSAPMLRAIGRGNRQDE